MATKLRILVPVKRVIDYAVRLHVLPRLSGYYLGMRNCGQNGTLSTRE